VRIKPSHCSIKARPDALMMRGIIYATAPNRLFPIVTRTRGSLSVCYGG
jgi:hypothetical protein